MDVCGVPTDACGHRGGSRRLPGRRRHLYSPDNPLPGTGGSHAPHRWTGSSSDCPSTLAPGAGSSKGVFTAKWEPSGGSRVELPPLLGAACSLYPQRNTGRGHTPFPTGCSLPSSSLSKRCGQLLAVPVLPEALLVSLGLVFPSGRCLLPSPVGARAPGGTVVIKRPKEPAPRCQISLSTP